MVPDQDIIIELVAKYARGEELGEEEMCILEAWWAVSNKNRLLAEVFREAEIMKAKMEADPEETELMWSAICRGLDEADAGDAGVETASVRLGAWKAWLLSAVAVVTIGFAGVYLSRWYRGDGARPAKEEQARVHPASESMIVLTRNDDSRVGVDTVRDGAVVERSIHGVLRKIAKDCIGFEVDSGSKENFTMVGLAIGAGHAPVTLRMPDGSLLCFSGRMTLSILFGDRARKIEVEGEGSLLSDIGKDAFRPFLIGAPNDANIKVLGTSFQVEVSGEKQETRVILLEGAIAVSSGGGSVQLGRPFQGAVVSGGRTQLVERVDTAGITGWSGDPFIFHFQHVELREALREVASRYGCKVFYKDSLQGTPLQGDMPKAASLDDILVLIRGAEVSYADVQKQDSMIVVSRWSNK